MTPNFMDAQQMHQDFPELLKVPSQDRLDKLAPGDLVKVCADEERFWIRVKTVEAEKVTGTIYSDLVLTGYHGLKANDEIEFEKKHIYIIE